MYKFIIPIILIILVLLVLAKNIVIVQQSRAYVVERLGAFQAVWGVGIHLKIPFIERVARKVSLKEQIADFPPQPVITKDNVTIQVDTVLFFQITDPKLYAYGVEHPMAAIENLTATTLRNLIGDLELDQSLTSRDIINAKMRVILDEATDPWGIKVNRVELKNIMPPREIQDAMEKQMKAERERREAILQAEGQKQSQILVAEGEKQSTILKADAEKQAAILHAEAERQAAVLRAEGEAEAIMKVQTALADSIKLLNSANPNDQVVKLKALESFEKAADGQEQYLDGNTITFVLEADGTAPVPDIRRATQAEFVRFREGVASLLEGSSYLLFCSGPAEDPDTQQAVENILAGLDALEARLYSNAG